MNYETTLYMITETKQQHRKAVKDLARVLKNFALYGWHDEELAEAYYARENTLFNAINVLVDRLPTLAVAVEL